MKKIILTIILIFVVTVSLSFALPISGSGELGSFSGDFNYNSSNSQITVSLTNTSPAGNVGFLTAFAFNIPVDFQITNFTAVNYRFDGPTTPVTTLSFGSFDTGAAFFNTSWGSGGQKMGFTLMDLRGNSLSRYKATAYRVWKLRIFSVRLILGLLHDMRSTALAKKSLSTLQNQSPNPPPCCCLAPD